MENQEKERYEKMLSSIIATIKEAKANGVTAEEIILSLSEIIPTRVVYDRQYKTSEEQRAYLVEYRKMQKELKLLKQKKETKRTAREKKIQKALQRVGFFCFDCKLNVKCNPENNSHIIEDTRHLNQKKLIILNKCPNCQKELRAFGGYLEPEI